MKTTTHAVTVFMHAKESQALAEFLSHIRYALEIQNSEDIQLAIKAVIQALSDCGFNPENTKLPIL